MKKLRVLLVFDWPEKVPEGGFVDLLGMPEMKTESDVYRALIKLGHEVELFGIHDSIDQLMEKIKAVNPHVVFNLSEAYQGDRRFEAHLVAFLELMGVKHTGADSAALRLCKDKSLTKKILSFHDIRVPAFAVSHKARPLKKITDFKYPAIIKPLGLEASEGISQTSLVKNESEALERVEFLHQRFQTDVIIEEYIPGRELYVGVLGNDRVRVLPARELKFKNFTENEPKIATFKAKWDEEYRKRRGIQNAQAKGLSGDTQTRLEEVCRRIYRLLEIKGYARVDLRLTPEGEIVFIEANPNPSIGKDEDFAQSAKKDGLKYEEMIAKLLDLARAA